jgi:hypothetical protein
MVFLARGNSWLGVGEGMDKDSLIEYFVKIDAALSSETVLYVYGSAVCILLDAPGRTSLDFDVAAPYSRADESELRRAVDAAGLLFNPETDEQGDFMEWIGPLRLCLPAPREERSMVLWHGKNLTITTGTVEDIVASRLVRFDSADQADIHFLHAQRGFALESVADAVRRLPAPFNADPVIRDNLGNLEKDMQLWRVRT